jgi:hypothetical protein
VTIAGGAVLGFASLSFCSERKIYESATQPEKRFVLWLKGKNHADT